MRNWIIGAAAAAAWIAVPTAASACDMCALFNAAEGAAVRPGCFQLSVSEQFTKFGEVRDDGRKIENPADERLRSSITQLAVTAGITESLQAGLSLPVIDRRYRRLEDGRSDTGSESGIGDISLIARWFPFEEREADFAFSLQFFGGLKLPTGNSDRLREEFEEGHHDEGGDEHHEEEHEESEVATHEDHEHRVRYHVRHGGEDHGEQASAIHGHDLALGSGSFDFPLGAALTLRQGRFFSAAEIQYNFRTEGRLDYEYADDFLWRARGGGYFLLRDSAAAALSLALSGEHKGRDNADGVTADDTGISTLFVGPHLSLTAGNDLSVEVGADYPVYVDNTDVQITPTMRYQAAVSVQF